MGPYRMPMEHSLQVFYTAYARWIDEADKGGEASKLGAALGEFFPGVSPQRGKKGASDCSDEEGVVGAIGFEPFCGGLRGYSEGLKSMAYPFSPPRKPPAIPEFGPEFGPRIEGHSVAA